MALPGSLTNPGLCGARFLLKPARKYQEADDQFSPYDRVKEPDPEARAAGAKLISANLRAHPSVLEVRWQVYANLEKWDGALDLATAIVKMVPQKPEGYIYTASTLQELGRQEEAHTDPGECGQEVPDRRDHPLRPGVRLLLDGPHRGSQRVARQGNRGWRRRDQAQGAGRSRPGTPIGPPPP